MCFIYFYLTLENNIGYLKLYLLEFDIGRLGKIWIQQGRPESKDLEQLWSRQFQALYLSSKKNCVSLNGSTNGHEHLGIGYIPPACSKLRNSPP
jgi:hypothetical protein